MRAVSQQGAASLAVAALMTDSDPTDLDPAKLAKFREILRSKAQRNVDVRLSTAERLELWSKRREVRQAQESQKVIEPSATPAPSPQAVEKQPPIEGDLGAFDFLFISPDEHPVESGYQPPNQHIRSRTGELRQLMVLMERPFFSLAKRRLVPLDYLSPDKTIHVSVRPGPEGMATIYDADLLMYLVSELARRPASTEATVDLRLGAYLAAMGSSKGGDQYALLEKAVQRLLTTQITTNAQFDGKPGPVVTFPWIERAVRQGNDWHLTVPNWIAEGARSKFILDICPEYFVLGGFDRCLYLTARKHVGRDRAKVFRIKVSTLWAKSGSASKLSRFRHELKSIAANNQLPEYRLDWEDTSGDGLLLMRCK